MSLPAFASVEDLAARIPGGISGDANEARAQAALDDASAIIRVEAGKPWVDDEELAADLPDIVVTVTLRAARRSYVNPEEVSQESAGPFSVSHSNASGDVYLTKQERSLVRRAAGRSGIWVQPTTRGAAVDLDLEYMVDVVGSDEPLPVVPPEFT